MEENVAKFEEKLKELVELGKKKKKVLEIQEISDFLSDLELSPEQMEKVYEYLEAMNIDVLRIGSDDDLDADIDDLILRKKRKKSIWRKSICLCRTESVLRIRCVCT